jgi:hypothetical protein
MGAALPTRSTGADPRRPGRGSQRAPRDVVGDLDIHLTRRLPFHAG